MQKMENYENRYLEQIKSQGFIKKLKHDAKTKNCAASRRLYKRVNKSFKNKDRKRRVKRKENILFYDSMRCGAMLTGKRLVRNECGVGNIAWGPNPVDISKPYWCNNDKKSNALFKSFIKNSVVDREDTRVATWLMGNMQSDLAFQQNFVIDCDFNEAFETYSDISPPSYSFKDHCKPYKPRKRDTDIFHVDMTQTSDLNTDQAVGEADDNFQYGGNTLNHKIHQCIWCPCVLFFSLLCCIPAILLMTKADKYFLKNDMKEADWHKKMSTTLYICGFVATILFYVAVALFVVSFV